jgi:hypothetical protein
LPESEKEMKLNWPFQLMALIAILLSASTLALHSRTVDNLGAIIDLINRQVEIAAIQNTTNTTQNETIMLMGKRLDRLENAPTMTFGPGVSSYCSDCEVGK